MWKGNLDSNAGNKIHVFRIIDIRIFVLHKISKQNQYKFNCIYNQQDTFNMDKFKDQSIVNIINKNNNIYIINITNNSFWLGEALVALEAFRQQVVGWVQLDPWLEVVEVADWS